MAFGVYLSFCVCVCVCNCDCDCRAVRGCSTIAVEKPRYRPGLWHSGTLLLLWDVHYDPQY